VCINMGDSSGGAIYNFAVVGRLALQIAARLAEQMTRRARHRTREASGGLAQRVSREQLGGERVEELLQIEQTARLGLGRRHHNEHNARLAEYEQLMVVVEGHDRLGTARLAQLLGALDRRVEHADVLLDRVGLRVVELAHPEYRIRLLVRVVDQDGRAAVHALQQIGQILF
jgi:hypothetical protein